VILVVYQKGAGILAGIGDQTGAVDQGLRTSWPRRRRWFKGAIIGQDGRASTSKTQVVLWSAATAKTVATGSNSGQGPQPSKQASAEQNQQTGAQQNQQPARVYIRDPVPPWRLRGAVRHPCGEATRAESSTTTASGGLAA
jgi:hypothetical protein